MDCLLKRQTHFCQLEVAFLERRCCGGTGWIMPMCYLHTLLWSTQRALEAEIFPWISGALDHSLLLLSHYLPCCDSCYYQSSCRIWALQNSRYQGNVYIRGISGPGSYTVLVLLCQGSDLWWKGASVFCLDLWLQGAVGEGCCLFLTVLPVQVKRGRLKEIHLQCSDLYSQCIWGYKHTQFSAVRSANRLCEVSHISANFFSEFSLLFFMTSYSASLF